MNFHKFWENKTILLHLVAKAAVLSRKVEKVSFQNEKALRQFLRTNTSHTPLGSTFLNSKCTLITCCVNMGAF
jgi:hypothetical protein